MCIILIHQLCPSEAKTMNGKLECHLYRYRLHNRSSWQTHLVTQCTDDVHTSPVHPFRLKVNCCSLVSSVYFHWLFISNSISLRCKLLNQLLTPPPLCVLALIHSSPRLFHSTDSTDFLRCADYIVQEHETHRATKQICIHQSSPIA